MTKERFVPENFKLKQKTADMFIDIVKYGDEYQGKTDFLTYWIRQEFQRLEKTIQLNKSK